MSRVALSLAAAVALAMAAQAAPAAAGKIGNTIAKTATKVAVKSAIRGGGRDGSDSKGDDEASARTSLDRQSVGGDADARAAHAKAKLAEENSAVGKEVASMTSDVTQNSNAAIICLAGCN